MNDIISGRKAAYEGLLLEAILQEATAREVYDKFFSGKVSQDAFFSLLSMDPTSVKGDSLESSVKGKYSDWLVRQYLSSPSREKFLGEDAEQIKNGLLVFDKLTKNKEGLAQLARALNLAEGQVPERDLARYSLAQVRSLSSVVDDGTLGSKSEDKTKVLLKTQKFIVLNPLTHAASRKWGTGTNWCTATANSYYFDKYTREGPLFIIVEKNEKGEHVNKWQYHAQTDQFMNRSDRPVSKKSWFTKIANRGPEWEDAVDQVAETLENNGCERFSLDRLFGDIKGLDRFKGISRNRMGFARQWDGKYLLTKAAAEMPFEDFLDLYDYIGTPANSPAIRDILQLSATTISAPRTQHILNLLKFVDEVDQDLIPIAVSSSKALDFGLVVSSFEALRLVLLTAQRLPEEDRPSAASFVLLDRIVKYGEDEEEEDKNKTNSKFFLNTAVKDLLSKKGGDDALLEILSTLFPETGKLTEARPRPTTSIQAVLDSTQAKQITKQMFFDKLSVALAPYSVMFRKTLAFITGKDATQVNDSVVKTGDEIVRDLMKTGNPLTEEDIQVLNYEKRSATYNALGTESIQEAYKEKFVPLLPAKAMKAFLKSLETSSAVMEASLFANVHYTALALAAAVEVPNSTLAKLTINSAAFASASEKILKVMGKDTYLAKNLKAFLDYVSDPNRPGTKKTPTGLTFSVNENEFEIDCDIFSDVKVPAITLADKRIPAPDRLHWVFSSLGIPVETDPTAFRNDLVEELVSRQGWTKLQNRYSCSITLKKRGAIR